MTLYGLQNSLCYFGHIHVVGINIFFGLILEERCKLTRGQYEISIESSAGN